MNKIILLCIFTPLFLISAHAQSKGDDVIIVQGVPIDSVIGSFYAYGYTDQMPPTIIDGKVDHASLSYTKRNALGTASINVFIFNQLDGVHVRSWANDFLLHYSNGWQKLFLQVAAVSGGRGGKVIYARTDDMARAKL